MNNSIDNFDRIRKLLDFSDEELFYYIQIIRRKKENPEAKSTKVIDNIYVSNMDYFNDKESYIKETCEYYNARAYIRLNRRNWEDVALVNLEQTAKLIRDKNYRAVKSSFSKACGRTHAEKNKIWIVDVDNLDGETETLYRHAEITDCIAELHEQIDNREYKIIAILPTKNGIHILTNPFNSMMFTEQFPDIDVHKDNPTILYMP